MEKVIVFLVITINALIYISLLIKNKRKNQAFKIIDCPILFEGIIFSALMYVNFVFYLAFTNFTYFILGIALCWLIAHLIYKFKAHVD